MTIPQTIRSLAVFDLMARECEALPVRVELRYDSRDPFAVHATFKAGPNTLYTEDVEWTFARDLVADGLLADSGTGDVRVRPLDEETVEIELSSPSGHAVFATSAADLADFVARTFELVPSGTEYDWLDVDLALEYLIESEASA